MICVDIDLLYVKWIPKWGPLCLIRYSICWGDWQWTEKVKPQTNDWQKIKHWNWKFPYSLRQKHRSDWMKTNFRQNSSLLFSIECSLIHVEQYISYMYSVRTVDNLTLWEFTTHGDKRGRQGKDCAWRQASCKKSSRTGAFATWSHRTYLWALIQTDISHHRKLIIQLVDRYECLILQQRRSKQTLGITPAALKDENRNSPDEVSVKTANVWPPTDCMVNGWSRGADTVLSSIPSITVSSSFKVKDTCKEPCHPLLIFSAPSSLLLILLP